MRFWGGVEVGVRFSGLGRLIGGVLRGDMASVCGITCLDSYITCLVQKY